jgi:hypothetical protein
MLLRGWHKPMVSSANDVDHSYEDQKPPDRVCVIKPETIKMIHIASTMQRKINVCASQAIIHAQ